MGDTAGWISNRNSVQLPDEYSLRFLNHEDLSGWFLTDLYKGVDVFILLDRFIEQLLKHI